MWKGGTGKIFHKYRPFFAYGVLNGLYRIDSIPERSGRIGQPVRELADVVNSRAHDIRLFHSFAKSERHTIFRMLGYTAGDTGAFGD